MAEVTTSIDGLYIRQCTNPSHYKCRSYTFTFDVPEDPAQGQWTIVTSGVEACAAYVKAHRFMYAHCVDEGEIIRLTNQEIGEPGQTSLYSWNDARDCTFEVETP
ncbi:hypothetical protein AB0L75_16380 [Streptomyces sp. NPDC052101]|uniref:hypothetical protein n=1 Tax=Streptomyces sp. NPDC052101 TaxID=3155763 RepID=UPI00343C6C08